MKKLITLALATSALATAPVAFADPSDSQTFEVKAGVQQECSVGLPTEVDFGNLAIETSAGATALDLTQGRTRFAQTVWISCNYGANMEIAAGPMKNQDQSVTTDADDFTDEIHFAFELGAGPGGQDDDFKKLQFNTKDNSSNARTQEGAFHSDSRIWISYLPQLNEDKKPLSGQYVSTATISVGVI